jgi:hypothetical protein
VGAALLMPIGPAAVAILRCTIPDDGLDTPATIVSKVAASPAPQSAVLWLGLVALFTIVPGAFAVLKLVRPRAPWLSLTAAALLIPGYLGLFGTGAGADLYVYVGTRAGIDRGLLADLLQLATGHPTVAIAGFVFVAGHILGSIAWGSLRRRWQQPRSLSCGYQTTSGTCRRLRAARTVAPDARA